MVVSDSGDIQSRVLLLWDALGGLSDSPLPPLSNPVVHIERKGPLVIAYIIDNAVVVRTVSGLTKFSVRRRAERLLGRKI